MINETRFSPLQHSFLKPGVHNFFSELYISKPTFVESNTQGAGRQVLGLAHHIFVDSKYKT